MAEREEVKSSVETGEKVVESTDGEVKEGNKRSETKEKGTKMVSAFEVGVGKLTQKLMGAFGLSKVSEDVDFDVLTGEHKAQKNFLSKGEKKMKELMKSMNNLAKEIGKVTKRFNDVFNEIAPAPEDVKEKVDDFGKRIIDVQTTLTDFTTGIETECLSCLAKYKKSLGSVEQSILYRDETKIKFDKQNFAVKKILKKQNRTPKDEEKLKKEKGALTSIKLEYREVNKQTKDGLVKVLASKETFYDPFAEGFFNLCDKTIATDLVNNVDQMSASVKSIHDDIKAKFEGERSVEHVYSEEIEKELEGEKEDENNREMQKVPEEEIVENKVVVEEKKEEEGEKKEEVKEETTTDVVAEVEAEETSTEVVAEVEAEETSTEVVAEVEAEDTDIFVEEKKEEVEKETLIE